MLGWGTPLVLSKPKYFRIIVILCTITVRRDFTGLADNIPASYSFFLFFIILSLVSSRFAVPSLSLFFSTDASREVFYALLRDRDLITLYTLSSRTSGNMSWRQQVSFRFFFVNARNWTRREIVNRICVSILYSLSFAFQCVLRLNVASSGDGSPFSSTMGCVLFFFYNSSVTLLSIFHTNIRISIKQIVYCDCVTYVCVHCAHFFSTMYLYGYLHLTS